MPVRPPSAARFAGKHLLVAHTQAAERYRIAGLFRPAGFVVSAARSAAEARAHLAHRPINLLVIEERFTATPAEQTALEALAAGRGAVIVRISSVPT